MDGDDKFQRVTGVRWSFFLDSITREMHQRQPTLGLWPARWRRVGSAFEDTEFSGTKQTYTETVDDLGYVNAFRRCPLVLRYRSGWALTAKQKSSRRNAPGPQRGSARGLRSTPVCGKWSRKES
jgi:hypothetical protein